MTKPNHVSMCTLSICSLLWRWMPKHLQTWVKCEDTVKCERWNTKRKVYMNSENRLAVWTYAEHVKGFVWLNEIVLVATVFFVIICGQCFRMLPLLFVGLAYCCDATFSFILYRLVSHIDALRRRLVLSVGSFISFKMYLSFYLLFFKRKTN